MNASDSSSRPGMLWGILTLLAGFVAVGSPLMSGLVVTMIVAITLLAAGISMAIYAFQAGSLGRGILRLLFGALTVIVGLIMLAQPGLALAKLTLLLGIYFVFDGIVVLTAAFKVRPQRGWGWLAFNGLATLLLAWFILDGWPLSGVWAIGVLVGIRLIFAV